MWMRRNYFHIFLRMNFLRMILTTKNMPSNERTQMAIIRLGVLNIWHLLGYDLDSSICNILIKSCQVRTGTII